MTEHASYDWIGYFPVGPADDGGGGGLDLSLSQETYRARTGAPYKRMKLNTEIGATARVEVTAVFPRDGRASAKVRIPLGDGAIAATVSIAIGGGMTPRPGTAVLTVTGLEGELPKGGWWKAGIGTQIRLAAQTTKIAA